MAVPSHHPHLYTAEEFAAMQRDGWRAELIEGEVVAMPAAFTDHGRTAMRLSALTAVYVLDHQLGETYTAETGFLISRNPDTVRAPDFSFIQANRVTISVLGPSWGGVIPDLVAEVISSSDRANEIDQKVQMWLTAGVRVVWVAWPQTHTIHVHAPPAPVQVLRDGDTLSGGTVIPGFSVAVSRIFS
jgi:Uma2 family endonuclease